ncbi:hypothetical protein KP509_29G067000 [Ceratopteris richardii]|nr:hypothetical protein KP509_29G067000 [Ceratopteris richardii]
MELSSNSDYGTDPEQAFDEHDAPRDKSEKYRDEYRREKDYEKHSKGKDKSKGDYFTKENKRRKEDTDGKRSHDRKRRIEESQRWEREYISDTQKKEKHRERDDDYSDHDSYRRDRHWDSSRSSYHKGSSKDRQKDGKRARFDGEQRSSNRARSPSWSPPKGRSPSPRFKDEERDRSSREREGGSRYRRSGLGGYSPRRRRSDAAIRTPSPPARSPERKKIRAWDLPPVGMDSGVAAAVAAAQQAAALASVSSLVTVNPAVATVSLTQATRNARRLYVGNVPAYVSELELMEFINTAMVSVNANHLPGAKPCICCMINVEKSYAFAEYLTPEDATAGLAFDGIALHGTTLKIRRPRDYVPPLSVGVTSSAVGMVSDVVPDSPRKIFVGGISKCISAEKLKEIVTAFGQLKAYHWEVKVNNNQIETYAFLEYLDPSVTPKACAGLNGMCLGNSTLTVVLATPNAKTEEDGERTPFYDVPEHARTLLQPPTRILELQDVITKEEAQLMSEEEFLEIEEDIRLECKRFGTVKSTHIVRAEVRSDEDSQKNLADEKSAEQFLLAAQEAYKEEVEKRINDHVASSGDSGPDGDSEGTEGGQMMQLFQTSNNLVTEAKGVPRAEPPEDEDRSKGSLLSENGLPENGSGGQETEDAVKPTAVLKDATQLSEEGGKNTTDDGDQILVTQPNDTNKQGVEDTALQEAQNTTSKPGEQNNNHQCQSESTQLVAVGTNPLNDSVLAQAAATAVESLNAEINESDIGRVYVEFTREECACVAAHALHGRLYGRRPVIAGYFPLKLYQKKFKKGLEPRTHEERQILALAAQERLNSFIPDRD